MCFMNKKKTNIIMICLLLTIIFYMITASSKVIESVSFSISILKDNLFPTLYAVKLWLCRYNWQYTILSNE